MSNASEKTIVVADRGWVWVGEVSEDADHVTIRNAQNVRRWGTTQGLGELALKGPQPNTKLDPAGTVKVPARAVIAQLACEASAWNG